MVNWLAGRGEPRSAPLGGQSAWHRLAGAPVVRTAGQQPAEMSSTPRHADFVVIGGGLAGLSTALELVTAEPGASIVLLESEVVGYGASGRNGGLLSPLPAPVWLLTAGRNAEHAWALKHINERVHAVAARLKAEAPDCGIAPVVLQLQALGRLTGTGLGRVGRTIAAAGIGVEPGRRPASRRGGGSRGAGHLTLDLATHSVDPYRTVRALAQLARARGIAIYEHTAVTAVEETDEGVRIDLRVGGSMTARRAIVATNGYTGSIALPEKIAAKVVWNFMVAAPLADVPVPPGEAEPARDLEGRFVVELNTSYVFYRVHQGRLVYGGIERFKPFGNDDFAVPLDVLAGLERHLERSFPGAGLVPAEAWGGRYHQTSTDLPLLQRAGGRGRIVINAGYGGTGVAMTMICGRLAAALARDERFLDDDDRRLYRAIKDTRMPVAGLARFVMGVAGDVLLGRFAGAADSRPR